MDEIARRYLELALRVGRHAPALVDAYYGPPEIKAAIDAEEPQPLDRLTKQAAALLAQLPAAGLLPQRQEYLAVQVRAIQTVIDKVAGQEPDFQAEAERIFDVTPAKVDESVFAAAHAEMDRLLPGSGELRGRLESWKKAQELSPDQVLSLCEIALAELRRRTLDLYDLPVGETLTIKVVNDQPWSAYNWYLGNYRSRIDINNDLPVRVNAIVPLLAHEAYAGHHTELAIKEQKLFKEAGHAEQSMRLLFAPECLLAEGIADSALDILFDDVSLVAFLGDVLYPAAGLRGFDAERQVRLYHVSEELKGVGGNAALLLHADRRPVEEVLAYVERWGLRTPQEAAQTLRFIKGPLDRTYIFTYAAGKELLAPLLRGPGARQNFGRLLAEPLTPGGVRRWIAQEQAAS